MCYIFVSLSFGSVFVSLLAFCIGAGHKMRLNAVTVNKMDGKSISADYRFVDINKLFDRIEA